MDNSKKRHQNSKKRKSPKVIKFIKFKQCVDAANKLIEVLLKPVPWYLQSDFYRETYCNSQ